MTGRVVTGVARRISPMRNSRFARAVARVRPSALVLMYHRVADLDHDVHGLAVTPARFAEQMAVLAADHTTLTADDLAKRIRSRRVPRRSVVVTIDDGYADNLHAGLPVLAAAGVPATVYVVSGAIDADREFWWDELERRVLIDPRPGSARVAGLDVAWGGSADRHHAHRLIHRAMLTMPATEQQVVLDRLAGDSRPPARASHRTMTGDELRRLAESPLIEIGAHTATHTSLSARTASDQDREIGDSIAALQHLLDRPVTAFSYPYGHYDAGTPGRVAAAGGESAVTADPGVATHSTDPYRIPRHIPGDWDGDTFARRLDGWFAGRD